MTIRKLSGACVGAVMVGALLSTAGASASTPTGSPSLASTTSSSVRLLTGDVVNLQTDSTGRQTANVVRAATSGPASVDQTFTIGSDMFVVPESAAPYLGSTLDPSLFDVTRLARHPQAGLHLSVTLRPGASRSALPGATLHHVSPTEATAVLTAAATRQFGRALAAQAMRDHASPTHTTGLFRGITHIAVATGAPVQRATRPADSHTLTLDGYDWNGNPDNGDSIYLYNIDDMTRFVTHLTLENGVAQATVPDGDYAATTFFYDFDSGNIYGVAIPQFTVEADTTMTIDARNATSQVSVTTPKPATPQVKNVAFVSTDPEGNSASSSFLAGPTNTFYVQPTRHKPTAGQFHYFVYTREFSNGSKGVPYTYDLKFPSDGKVPADQSYAPKQKSLATIDARYAADHPNQPSLDTHYAVFPWETFLFTADIAFTSPLHRLEYYTAKPGLQWEDVDYSVFIPGSFTLLGQIDTSWEVYTPGMKRTEVFRGQPTIPRLLEHNLGLSETFCPACIGPSVVNVLAFPFSDSSPYHRSYTDGSTGGLSESTNWSLKADASVISAGTGLFYTSRPIVQGAKVYTLHYDESRSSSDFLLSTRVSTTWKVATDAPEPQLPDGWFCDLDRSTDCTVLPVMSDQYDLPVDLLGKISSGDQHGNVLITHLADAPIRVKHVTFELSYDGGKTWSPATVTNQKHGHFEIAFTVPDRSQTNGYGAIRLVAKDASGGVLNQTIVKGFAIK